MTSPGRGNGASFDFVIEARRFFGRLCVGDGVDNAVVEVFDPQRLPIATLEPFIFLDGEEYNLGAAVARDANGLPEGLVLPINEIFLNFGGSCGVGRMFGCFEHNTEYSQVV